MSSDQKEFIKLITPAALKATAGTKIFPAVAIARAIIESGDGKGNYGLSRLNKEANNFFGITASKNYKGDRILVKTWEGKKIPIYGEEKFLGEKDGRYNYERYFRSYDTPEHSFKDFVNLVSSGRYKDSVTAATPAEQASIISKAGYATAANAEELFMKITNKVHSALDEVITIVKKKKSEIALVAAALALLGIGIYVVNK